MNILLKGRDRRVIAAGKTVFNPFIVEKMLKNRLEGVHLYRRDAHLVYNAIMP